MWPPHLAPELDVNRVMARADDPNATVYNTDFKYPYSSFQVGGIAILFIFPSLALIIVVLRVYIRLKLRQLGIDDWLICLAMAISIAETGCSYKAMRAAFFGVHMYDIPLGVDMRPASFWNYVIQLLYNPILAIVKTSVLLFMLRLGGQQRNVRLSIYALIVFNLLLMVSTFIVVIFQCTPINYFWEQRQANPPKGHCIKMTDFYLATAFLTIVTDILVLALPFWIFLGLKMALKLKLALIGVFCLGGVVSVIGCLRFQWVYEIGFHPNLADFTYDIRFVYSTVETNLAIIAASAPAIRGLIIKWLPSLFVSGTGSTPKYGTDGLPISSSKKPRSRSQQSLGASNALHPSTHHSHAESFALKNLKKQDPYNIPSPTASEEHIMAPDRDAIVCRTDVHIAYDHKARSIDGQRWRSFSRDGTTDLGMSGYDKTVATPGI